MRRALGTICIGIIGATLSCAAAELEKKAESPQAKTNMFSNWTIVSTNLTVKSPGVPWGSSKRSFVAATPQIKRELLERLAEKRQIAEEQLRREKMLNGPDAGSFHQFHVHLSRTRDQFTNSPAK